MTEKKFQNLTENAQFWNGKDLEVGAKIEGVICLIKEPRDAKSSGVLTLELEDKTRVNVWQKTIIASALNGIAKVGDTVRLTYNGLKDPKNGGAQYHDYTVELAQAE